MFKFSLSAFSLICLSTASADEWVFFKPQLGIGFSDNVYQDDLNKKSDSFAWVQAQTRYSLSDSKLTAKINLTTYSTEVANNSLSYSLYSKSEVAYANLGLTLGLGGFSYLKSQVASTDESFNNFYFIGYVTKSLMTRNEFELSVEPGLKFSTYPQLSGRNDISFFTKLDALWSFSSNRDINPYFELGFLFSNKSYYAKNYVDLGILWNERIDDLYRFSVDYSIRSSSYPNRRVSDILFIPNRSGRNTSVKLNSSENISLTQLLASITRSETSHEYSLGLNYATENSLSQLEYFTELQLLASVQWTF